MAHQGRRGQPGLDVPFLVSYSPERYERSEEIKREVREYLRQLKAALPLHQMASVLPQNARLPELPMPPDCMIWSGRIERWGFPNPGTWMDQPKWFMEDMDAVERARDAFQDKQAKPNHMPAIPADMIMPMTPRQ